MSLYYEAAAILANPDKTGGSLKSRLFKKTGLKSTPGQLFALITEASKWSLVLKDVIEISGVLAEEKKLTPVLALLLTHDLVLAKNGVAAPANHVLKLAINRHKARLTAEFTKARVRAGYPTIDAFRTAVNNGELEEDDDAESAKGGYRHPRWVRINTIKTTLQEQLSRTFEAYKAVESIEDILAARGSSKLYFLDPNIPNLLALPSRIDLSRHPAYLSGQIIIQDKASCFPAYLLNATPDDGDIIDGCAAPGNKTTHLAAILKQQLHDEQKIFAFERDKVRAKTLEKMVKIASADQVVKVKAAHDFLASKPNSPEFSRVGAILLDPSCSGSGIVGRDDVTKMHLPSASSSASQPASSSRGKKRKRDDSKKGSSGDTTLKLELDEDVAEESPMDSKLPERLTALSTFQLRILTHAMGFPAARKITYSTCSIHFEENEGVVLRALKSAVAKQGGWRILKREEQVQGMKNWGRRGVAEDDKASGGVEGLDEILEACIRCEKGTNEGTMGFFVAGFVRDESYITHVGDAVMDDAVEEEANGNDDGEEWGGFSDDEPPTTSVPEVTPITINPTDNKKKKKKRRKN